MFVLCIYIPLDLRLCEIVWMSSKLSRYNTVFNNVFTHFTARLQQKWWLSCWEVTQKTMLRKHALMPTGKLGDIVWHLLLTLDITYIPHTCIGLCPLSLGVSSVLSKTPTPSWLTTCSPWNLFASWRENSFMTWVLLCGVKCIKDITGIVRFCPNNLWTIIISWKILIAFHSPQSPSKPLFLKTNLPSVIVTALSILYV